MAPPPSASAATTAYTQPNYSNQTYGNQPYGNNYPSSQTAQYAAAPATVTVPASYGSPSSIDAMRRTDSLIGGAAAPANNYPAYEFNEDPSPASSDGHRDVWGNEVGSYRNKRTASNVSVEF
ncbi:hypothetical protein BBJ28_00001870 [Nothophytophthora sp. Chile5]|nr:hypothetical protein BBJ28_00001870 [Nothophytophthora sp. Chile5]